MLALEVAFPFVECGRALSQPLLSCDTRVDEVGHLGEHTGADVGGVVAVRAGVDLKSTIVRVSWSVYRDQE